MKIFFNDKKIIIPVFILAIFLPLFLLDAALGAGLALLLALCALTYYLLSKTGLTKNKSLLILLAIALVLHVAAALFIYYAHFYPFSGGAGGFKTVDLIGKKLSDNIRHGNFSFEGVPYLRNAKYPYRHYELIVGAIYTITLPEMVTGQLFNAWLAVLAILAIYLIVIELGAEKKIAFLAGLIASFYPSHLLYGSLLLKDGLVTVLALFGLLLCLKLVKTLLLKKNTAHPIIFQFIIFYIILLALIHFRFYIGYALLFTLVISLLAFFPKYIKERSFLNIIISSVIIAFLAFAPVFEGQGILGFTTFKAFLNHETLGFYHEGAYQPGSTNTPDCSTCDTDSPAQYSVSELIDIESENSGPVCLTACNGTSPILNGYGSSWKRERVSFLEHPAKFLFNYLKYSSYVFFGPFPWQMTQPQHFLVLFETIPWYFLFLAALFGIYKSIKDRNKLILPLIVFALLVIGVMVLFISNFGIVTRIRMPALIVLFCFAPLGFVYISDRWFKTMFYEKK